MDEEIKSRLEKEVNKIMRDLINEEFSEYTTFTNATPINQTNLKGELESLIKKLEEDKIRLFVNQYIPMGNIIKFKELGSDEYSYGVNTITFAKMKKADPSFIYGFKIIYNNKYKNI